VKGEIGLKKLSGEIDKREFPEIMILEEIGISSRNLTSSVEEYIGD